MTTRSTPPPIPSTQRRRPITVANLAKNQPESPTVLERAVARLAELNDAARAPQLAREVETTGASDPVEAAMLGYELGELHERLGNGEAALAAYRSACEHDPSLRPAAWALRRLLYKGAAWPDLAKQLDGELARAGGDEERVDWYFERAIVAVNAGADEQALAALDALLALAPRHQGALFELERIVARAADAPALLDVWERLANAAEHPDRKIGYCLEIARLASEKDPARAQKALEAAARLAAQPGVAQRVARERLRIAELRGDQASIVFAIEALAQNLSGAQIDPARRRELVALRRRQAQLVRGAAPARAWQYLEQALALAPDEPVLLVDQIDLATELARDDDLPALIKKWQAAESDAARAAMLSIWCAEAHAADERRPQLRTLLRALEPSAPGFVLLAATEEAALLRGPAGIRASGELAGTYLRLARAAARGTWLGAAAQVKPDPAAATALFVQAAHVLAFHVGTAGALEQAREALDQAREVEAGNPAVLETLVELDAMTGRAAEAIAMLRETARGTDRERASIERAIRIAYTQGASATVLDLERELLALDPADRSLAWRVATLLGELGTDARAAEDRRALLERLAREDKDDARRATALLQAALLHERAGAMGRAAELYRELAALHPDAELARDATIALLRAQGSWADLARERRVEAARLADPSAIRRALREAAWVLEVHLGAPADAVKVYEDWLARMPDDRTALEGLARCRAALGERAGEAAARARIAELDGTAEARWLHARSLERAAEYPGAEELYLALAAADDLSVASASAMLAFGDLSVRDGNLHERIESGAALARRTTDPRLGAALLADAGWSHAVALDNVDAAADAFEAALAAEPSHAGALLGSALVAARRADPAAVATAHVALAQAVQMPELAGALLLRAAANAAVGGDVAIANKRVQSARDAAPESTNAMFMAAEHGARKAIKRDDPFAAVDELLARAELLAARAELADDDEARAPWELERAEALETAGQLGEAALIAGAVYRNRPDDVRAIALLRRLAHRMIDKTAWAQASYAMARRTRDPQTRLDMLRDAAAVFERPGVTHNAGALLAVNRERIRALSDLLTELDGQPAPDEAQVVSLLLERASLLASAGHLDHALADTEAVLELYPDNSEARRVRTRLGSVHNVVDAEDVATTGQRPVVEPTGQIWAEAETTTTEAQKRDLFGGTTLVADISRLQEQERREARTSKRIPVQLEVDARDTSEVPRMPDRLRPPALDLDDTASGREVEPVLDAGALQFGDDDGSLPEDSDVVMLSYEDLKPTSSEDASRQLLAYHEREIAASSGAAEIEARIEAGRLAESLGELDRAVAHYEAAFVADPRALVALRGLRRIARVRGDVQDVVRLVDAELALAGPREREPLAHYRVDLLMAMGEQDLARVAVGTILDSSPLDVPALLAQLELAFLDDRADELASSLEKLSRALVDPALRSTVLSARSLLADRESDAAAAATWGSAAIEAYPDSLAMRLAAIDRAVRRGNGVDAGAALFELACHVEGEDPVTAAALALRAQAWASDSPDAATPAARETIANAAQLAARAAPRDAIVARITAETALATGDHAVATHAFSRWVRCKSAPVERAYAAARAAELEPGKLGRLWAQVLELDPGCDYAAARLRDAMLAAGETQQATERDLEQAQDGTHPWLLLRACSELVARGELEAATNHLEAARARQPESAGITDALADAYARAGRWDDRAKLLGDAVARPGIVAPELARLRSALAWEKAAHVAAASGEVSRDELARTTVAALDAWAAALESDPRAPEGHAAGILLASRLPDPDILVDALTRAQAAERSPWAASTLALQRARLVARTDPRLAQEIAQQRSTPDETLDDPRRTVVAMLAAMQRQDLGDAATALEQRAAQLDQARGDATHEAATLRLRAALISLELGDAARALPLLERADAVVPGLVEDLLDVARRRAGQASAPAASRTRARTTSFTRVLHDADLATARGDGATGVALYQRALELRPGDPLAAQPLLRVATARGDQPAVRALLREQLRTAAADDQAGIHELLARVELDLANNDEAAQREVDAALATDPTRLDLLYALARRHIPARRHAKLLALREKERELVKGSATARDLAALAMDAAALAARDRRPDAALVELYRAVLAAQPRDRLALFHLETLLRRAGFSDERIAIEERIAEVAPDPRSKAAFLTRAGDSLLALRPPAEAVQRYVAAADAMPAYVPALDAWYRTALAHQLWPELAEAATRKANLGGTREAVAALHHLAGVALMDKAHAHDPAIAAFRRALDADPSHVDAFLRLRALFENRPDELAALLSMRLEIEPDAAAKIELHRTLAEHWIEIRQRDRALKQYRALLRLDPADVRAHAAIAEIATGETRWQEAVDAVQARIVLEADPRILRNLHHRLGALYAGHDDARALEAFQTAAAARPGDLRTLARIVDVAIGAGEWQTALTACEQLVTTEREPERLASHLLRAATIFGRGLGDQLRADRMLDLAVESAPDMTAAAMREQIARDAQNGPAYRTLSRATVHTSPRVARIAAELAEILGASGDPERRLISERPVGDLSILVGTAADEQLCAGMPAELRQVLRAIGSSLARQLPLDLEAYGVHRKERLNPADPIVAIARELGAPLGFRDVEVHIASRYPYAMVADVTQPITLVLGSGIASGEPPGIRFAVGAALKLAQLSLALPARLPLHDLGVLVTAVLRLHQPDATGVGVDPGEVSAQLQKLRRGGAGGLVEEARVHAAGIRSFDPRDLARDLKIVGLRAGLAASGTVLPGLALVAAAVGSDLPGVLMDPVARGVVNFGLGISPGVPNG